MRPLDVSNGSPLPSYVNGNSAGPDGAGGTNKLQAAWAAQAQRARDFWGNMDGEGRVSILGIALLLALSVGTVVMGESAGAIRAWRGRALVFVGVGLGVFVSHVMQVGAHPHVGGALVGASVRPRDRPIMFLAAPAASGGPAITAVGVRRGAPGLSVLAPRWGPEPGRPNECYRVTFFRLPWPRV